MLIVLVHVPRNTHNQMVVVLFECWETIGAEAHVVAVTVVAREHTQSMFTIDMLELEAGVWLNSWGRI